MYLKHHYQMITKFAKTIFYFATMEESLKYQGLYIFANEFLFLRRWTYLQK